MTAVTDEYDYVVGVDTHAKTHTYAVLAADTGRVIDSAMFPTSPTGISRALAWMHRRGDGRLLIAIEGLAPMALSLPGSSRTRAWPFAMSGPRNGQRVLRAASPMRSTPLPRHAPPSPPTSSGSRPHVRTGSAPPCGSC